MVLIIMADVRGSGSKVFTFENCLIQKKNQQKTKQQKTKQEEQMLNWYIFATLAEHLHSHVPYMNQPSDIILSFFMQLSNRMTAQVLAFL